MNFSIIKSTLARTYSEWSSHDAPRLAAALSFYTLLSLAPLVILVLAILALAFGNSGAQTQLLAQVQSMVGEQGAQAVEAMIAHASKPASGALASLIGLITLLFGASGVFGELRAGMNRIWDVQPASQGGLWALLRERFFSFAMVLAVGFLLLVSLVLSAALAAGGKYFGSLLPLPELVLTTLDLLISLASIACLFALIFRYVPETRAAWKNIWIGAIATALLFTLGKFLIGLYLGKAAVGSPYGAAGSLVVVLVWVYYSSMLFFFGAAFTHVLESESVAQKRATRPHVRQTA